MTDLFTERDKKKAKAFVKGANTGIAQALGFPVDAVTYAINMSPLLVNLLLHLLVKKMILLHLQYFLARLPQQVYLYHFLVVLHEHIFFSLGRI